MMVKRSNSAAVRMILLLMKARANVMASFFSSIPVPRIGSQSRSAGHWFLSTDDQMRYMAGVLDPVESNQVVRIEAMKRVLYSC